MKGEMAVLMEEKNLNEILTTYYVFHTA